MRDLAPRVATGVRCGLHAAARAVLRRLEHPVVVLAYHRVTTLASDHHRMAVSPSNFHAQVRALRDGFPILRFEEEWSQANGPAVVVTFDDGYADNAREALPILEELRAPATFFVSTGTIGTSSPFWWDELEGLALGEGIFPASFTVDDGGRTRSWPTATREQRRLLHDELHRLLLRSGPARRSWLLSELRRWLRSDGWRSEAHRAMTVDELRRLARSPLVTLGAHSVTHTALARLPTDEQWGEIVGSKRQLESWTGREVRVFSYPFGAPSDYTRTTRALCERAGFQRVAANFPGQAYRGADRLQIPRFVVRDWTAEEFARRLQVFVTA